MPSAGTLKAYAGSTATISTTALTLSDIGFTAAELKAANQAHISVFAQPIRYRYDGGVVTASTGHQVIATEELILDGNANVNNLSMIREGASDATLWITLSTYGIPPA